MLAWFCSTWKCAEKLRFLKRRGISSKPKSFCSPTKARLFWARQSRKWFHSGSTTRNFCTKRQLCAISQSGFFIFPFRTLRTWSNGTWREFLEFSDMKILQTFCTSSFIWRKSLRTSFPQISGIFADFVKAAQEKKLTPDCSSAKRSFAAVFRLWLAAATNEWSVSGTAKSRALFPNI